MGLGEGRARRLSLGAAITFGVAIAAGVVGNRLTGRVTPALLVFAGLVVAGMLLSYWVDRGARPDNTAAGRRDVGSATGRPALNDVRGIQQNIIAAAPGAVAQGALGGNVINHRNVEWPGTGTPASSDPTGGERDGKS
jgi:hypothetical protein